MEQWINQLYKSKGNFAKQNLENRRSIIKNNRKDKRISLLQHFRNIPEDMSFSNSPIKPTKFENKPALPSKKNERYEMLLKWKEEKQKRKAEAKKLQKPPFKVYHVEARDDLDDALTSIKGKKIPVKIQTPLINKTSTKNLNKHEKQIQGTKYMGTSKSHMKELKEKSEKPTSTQNDKVFNKGTTSKTKVTEENLKSRSPNRKKIIQSNEISQQKESSERNSRRALRQIKRSPTGNVENNPEQDADKLKAENKSSSRNLRTKQTIIESTPKIANPLEETISPIAKLPPLSTSSINNSKKRNTRQTKDPEMVSFSVQNVNSVEKSARRSLKSKFDTNQNCFTALQNETEKKTPQRYRKTLDVSFKSEDKRTVCVLKETSDPQSGNRRRSRRMLDIDQSEQNISHDVDSSKKKKKKSSPRLSYSISSSKETILESNSARKSILNTPAAEWKLILNESFSKARTPVESNRRKSTRRSIKKNNLTSTASEEFYTPDKMDGNDITNNVFITPTDDSSTKEENIVYVSPFVTISRGKNAARKEFEKRKSGLSATNPSDPTSPKAAAGYFTRLLNNTISNIEEKCRIWQSYKDEGNLSEDACGLIDMTIGQSNLLIAKKFNQFRGLIEKCHSNDESEAKITCEDLHGFWDMIYKQVDNLDKRFENLDDMKKNNWLENVPEKKTQKKNRKKGNKKTKQATAASSMLRETILAARRKKSEEQSADNDIEILVAKKRLCTPQMKSDVSTPGKSILKTDNTRSEKRKTVIFKDVRRSEGKENNFTPTGIRKTPNSTRKSGKLTPVAGNTPHPVRKSERISLGRSKLMFE